MTKKEMYNELMGRTDRLFDNHFQYLHETDYKYFEPLKKAGFKPEYVHVWGNVYVNFRRNQPYDTYEVSLTDNDSLNDTIYQCVTAWMDNRECEINERTETMTVEQTMYRLLEYTKGLLKGTEYKAEVKDGKHDGYHDLFIYYGDGSYCMVFEVYRNRFYEYTITSAAPLCGECRYEAGTQIEKMECFIREELAGGGRIKV